MNSTWLDEVRKRLAAESARDSGVHLERLQAQGIIDDHGEVTGKLRRWDAFLAITAVMHAVDNREIAVFRCLKPVFGVPGGALIDVRRESMVDYLDQRRKVITAIWDDRLKLWKEGEDIRLSPNGFVRNDTADNREDNVGSLPELQQPDSRC